MGSLRLKVQAHEERILAAPLYETFVATMLRAVEDPRPEGSPILVMLEEVMTMDRNALAQTLVRFYLAHGSVLPFLDTLTMREIHQTCELVALSLGVAFSFAMPSSLSITLAAIHIDMCLVHLFSLFFCPLSLSLSAATPRTLFRGNSLASKSFDQFMKVSPPTCKTDLLHGCNELFLNPSFSLPPQVVALPFLHEILSGAIDTVYNDHKVCELDIEQLKQGSK